MDGSQVKHEVDFYCLLGEVFFGKEGYFGQGPDGFNDCFSEIHMQNPNRPLVEPNESVTIKNKGQFEKVLNRKYEDYFSVFIADLKSTGFEVEFDS